jgi:predicted transposase YbfD/YdcC
LSKAFGRSIRWAILYGFTGSMDDFVGLENRLQREDFGIQVLIAFKDLSPGALTCSFRARWRALGALFVFAEHRMKLKAEEGFRKSQARKIPCLSG